jgi:hypothetical protein
MMEWWLLAIAGSILAGVFLALASVAPFASHPDLDKIQRPINPAISADIERRGTE